MINRKEKKMTKGLTLLLEVHLNVYCKDEISFGI